MTDKELLRNLNEKYDADCIEISFLQSRLIGQLQSSINLSNLSKGKQLELINILEDIFKCTQEMRDR